MTFRTLRRLGLALPLTLGAALAACAGETAPASDDEDFSSNQATLLRFEFDGEFVTSRGFGHEKLAQDQLLYTIGQLNGDRAVGRLDAVEISRVSVTKEGTKNLVKFHAVLPVGWASKTEFPESYDLKLPRDLDALKAFTDAYSHTCVDAGAHDVDEGSFWYYYRPAKSACKLDPAALSVSTASITKAPENTSGKYPEYDKIWEDDALDVVSVFGKYEDGATSSSDAGISAYNRFVASMRDGLGVKLASTPENVSTNPGVATPTVSFTGKLADGKTVNVTAILVDNVSQAGAEFDELYEPLSTEADLIFYNGHAGLGQNVRALANKGEFRAGKYQIFFMNGCDTFAYVDGSLAETRAALNPDDPTGTKYMEIITNLMPSFFSSMPNATLSVMKGLLSYAKPKTYDEIFATIDKSQVVVVTGEEDNAYTPDGAPPPSTWSGLSQAGTVERGETVEFETPELEPGDYVVKTTEGATAGGDVDLYVAKGRKPTETDWDYRPYQDGSNEEVTVKLATKSKIYIAVRGYDQGSEASSSFALEAKPAAKK